MSPAPEDHATVRATITSTLDTLDDAVNYMSWIVEMVRPHLAGPILEVGAGHGTFTGTLADIADVHAVEPGDHGASVLDERFGGDPRVTITHGVVEDLPEAAVYGSAVMINVLEHIADDEAALVAIRSRMVPGAQIAVWVPAFPVLYSQFDRRLGHYRRYRIPELRAVAQRAGFRVDDARYVNSVGFFSWLIAARMMGNTVPSPFLVSVFDRWFVPVLRFVESRIRMPIGQSILLIATASAAADGTRPDHG